MAEKENSNSENTETKKNEQIREYGQTKLEHNIHLLSVIGEIEGHECLSSNTKTTKYEHVLPQLAAIEDSSDIQGLLVLLNTVGGDVEAGLAIAEMIASIDKLWTGARGDDCFAQQTDRFTGHRGQPFDRCADRCLYRLFLYCPDRNDGHPSGPYEWNNHWSPTDL